MIEPLDLFSAMTDVDDQDVLEALDIYTKNPQNRKLRKMIVVVIALIILVSAGIVTHWLLQRKTGNVDNGDEANEILYTKNGPTPTHYSIEHGPSVPQNNTSVCEIYQFMLWDENEYIASIEHSDRIGAERGAAKVRNEEKDSETTLYKDVIIYEIVGMDTAIAVLVYYPEDQEYYVYYNSTY